MIFENNSVLSCTSVGTTWTLTGLGLKKTLFCHSLSKISSPRDLGSREIYISIYGDFNFFICPSEPSHKLTWPTKREHRGWRSWRPKAGFEICTSCPVCNPGNERQSLPQAEDTKVALLNQLLRINALAALRWCSLNGVLFVFVTVIVTVAYLMGKGLDG